MARAARASSFKDEHQRAICKAFYSLADVHGRHTVWSDFVTMSACTIGVIDPLKCKERGKLYVDVAKKYSPKEIETFTAMYSETVMGFEEDSDQDFLGDLFMRLELGNEWKGQFFTPYNVCKMMSRLILGDVAAAVADRGYVSVNDPACGAGALLIAAAHEAKRQGVNYQQNILFVAQDIDFIAAMMCYIQLSLLGCPGYVIVGNTLTTPPTTPLAEQNVWYTPLYFLGTWPIRSFLEKEKQEVSRAESEPPDTAPKEEVFEQLSLL